MADIIFVLLFVVVLPLFEIAVLKLPDSLSWPLFFLNLLISAFLVGIPDIIRYLAEEKRERESREAAEQRQQDYLDRLKAYEAEQAPLRETERQRLKAHEAEQVLIREAERQRIKEVQHERAARNARLVPAILRIADNLVEVVDSNTTEDEKPCFRNILSLTNFNIELFKKNYATIIKEADLLGKWGRGYEAKNLAQSLAILAFPESFHLRDDSVGVALDIAGEFVLHTKVKKLEPEAIALVKRESTSNN